MSISFSKSQKLILALIVLATLYILHPFQLYFLADDFLHIPESRENFWMQRNSIRPVGNLSLHIDEWFSGTNALGYHITNLLLHVFSSCLVLAVTEKLLSKFYQENAKQIAILAAVLFFCYPFHSESIFWIIGRSGSLGTLFFLLSFYLYLTKPKNPFFILLSLAAYLLALLSYESSWIYPLTLLLLILFTSKEERKNHLVYFLLVCAVFSLYIFLRLRATGEMLNHYDAQSFVQLKIGLLLRNFSTLFARTFLPPFYKQEHFMMMFMLLVIVIIAIAWILYKLKRIDKLVIFLLIVWLISYLPYLSLGVDTHGTEGERYLYLPSFFFCLLLIVVFKRFFSFNLMFIGVVVTMLFSLFYLKQSRTYYDKAGRIAKITLQEIGKPENGNKNILLQNLPQYNKGAVVFRIGLENAVQWFYPQSSSNIIILSKDNSDEEPKENYYSNFTVKAEEMKTSPSFTKKMILDKSFKQNYLSKDTLFNFQLGRDILFSYTDTTLAIKK